MRREIFHALTGDYVGEIVFTVVVSETLEFPVHVKGVVVESTVPYQTVPVGPSGWNPRPVVAV